VQWIEPSLFGKKAVGNRGNPVFVFPLTLSRFPNASLSRAGKLGIRFIEFFGFVGFVEFLGFFGFVEFLGFVEFFGFIEFFGFVGFVEFFGFVEFLEFLGFSDLLT